MTTYSDAYKRHKDENKYHPELYDPTFLIYEAIDEIIQRLDDIQNNTKSQAVKPDFQDEYCLDCNIRLEQDAPGIITAWCRVNTDTGIKLGYVCNDCHDKGRLK